MSRLSQFHSSNIRLRRDVFMRSAVIEYAVAAFRSVAVGWFDGGLAGGRNEEGFRI